MVAKYETPDFIKDDPVQYPHRFDSMKDIEVIGLLTAIISWGNRKQIIKSCDKLITMMGNRPFDFIYNGKWQDINPEMNIHRTFFGSDLIFVCRGLQYIYQRIFSLELIKHDNVWQWIENLQKAMYVANAKSNRHIAPSGVFYGKSKYNSPYKRLNMFLRWMIRTGSPVDLGVWTHCFNTDELIIPLDVHVSSTARKLGMCDRKSNDRVTAELITDKLRDFDIKDPVKYDFALFGIGINDKK